MGVEGWSVCVGWLEGARAGCVLGRAKDGVWRGCRCVRGRAWGRTLWRSGLHCYVESPEFAGCLTYRLIGALLATPS